MSDTAVYPLAPTTRVLRSCPLCSWRTRRRLLPSMYVEAAEKLNAFAMDCHGDLRQHLIEAHGEAA